MTDKTELKVTQRAREAAADYAKYHGWHEPEEMRSGKKDDMKIVQSFARFERNILATRTPDPTPVAKVRVKHGGYGMELATYVAYGLPEGDHWLYAHPPAIPADGLVVSTIIQDVCELDGFTAADDPNRVVITVDELTLIVQRALAAHRGEA